MTTQKFKWQGVVSKYAYPETWRSLWQVFNSVIPFIVMWYFMYRSLAVGYWLTLILAFPTAGFMVRCFIIFHDCCHGSFLRTMKANDRLGLVIGVLVLTPFYQWKHSHAIHHAWYKKVGYRIMRNPVILFTVGSFIVFTITHRFFEKSAGKRERSSVIWTNIAIAAVVGWIMLEIGWAAFLLVEVPVLLITCGAGVWLFYVQHNFDPTYWERNAEWEFFNAGMDGSSFYKLPKVLQWFTGNIGFHHIHHLSPRIPNYKLEKCHNENPMFQVEPLTFEHSLKSLFFRLWDEKEKTLVGWSALKKYRTQSVKVEA